MSKRIPTVTRQLIEAAILPIQTKTYTVIPHSDVIAITEKILGEKGFIITADRYKCTKSAQVAQGVYHLDFGDDPEMKMMFAWSNSYDKSLRFRCGVGGILQNGATILSGANLGSWARRHSGNALQETTDTIKNQIDHAGQYYAQLVYDKECMKNIPLDFKGQSEMAGRIFVELNLINTEQVSDMKNWIRADRSKDNLWTMYEYIVTSLQKSHPAKWMDAQIAVHYWVTNEFNIPSMPAVIPTMAGVPGTGVPIEEVAEVPGPGHQVTLDEAIMESVGLVVLDVDSPEFKVPFEIVKANVEKALKVTMAERAGISDLPTKAQDLTAMLAEQSKFAEESVAPAIQAVVERAHVENKSVNLEIDVMVAVETAQDIPGETDGQGFELPDPTQPHIFTVEKDEDTKCFICDKLITDSIHEAF